MTRKAVPLTSIKENTRVKIASLGGGTVCKSKLTAMGMHVSLMIKVMHNEDKGPVLIEVKGIRIALGQGMASKILVDHADEAASRN
jgi:Fe2+ transport system protein FeoA